MARRLKQFSVQDLFGIPMQHGDGSPATLVGYSEPGPNTLGRVPGYEHRREHIRRLVVAYQYGLPVVLSGPTGSGKTDMLMDFMSALNLEPVIQSSSDENETADFTGKRVLASDGSSPFVEGPLVRAMREGRPLLLDEMDRNRPGLLVKYNHVFEGHPFEIEDTGEVIRPAPGFWVAATMNTVGGGDSSGAMASALAQDRSTMGRFVRLKVGYHDTAERARAKEELRVTGYGEEQLDTCADMLVQFFRQARKSGVQAPVGTRNLVMAARFWANLGNPREALDATVFDAIDEDDDGRALETLESAYESIFAADTADATSSQAA